MNPHGQPVPASGVLGGGVLKVDDYAGFVAREYLAGYLPAGGAAVKVAVVGDGGAADRLESALAAASAQHGGVYVSIAADATRVHMIDQIFFAISQAVDWEGLAAAHVRAAYDDAAFPVPAGAGLTVTEVARHHDMDSRELYRSVRRLLERSLLGNPIITTEMGRAMLRLAQAQLGAGDIDTAVHDAYEVLRQFIDATDELRGVLLLGMVPPELMTDESRGLPAYTALQLRVADEVRDRRRANPFAALVRLEVRLEAVA